MHVPKPDMLSTHSTVPCLDDKLSSTANGVLFLVYTLYTTVSAAQAALSADRVSYSKSSGVHYNELAKTSKVLCCLPRSLPRSTPHSPPDSPPERSCPNAGRTVAMRQQACALLSSTCQPLAALPKQAPPCCFLPAAMTQHPWLLKRCPYTTMSAKPLWPILGEHLVGLFRADCTI